MPEDGFEALCEEVSGLELGDFFDATVRGTGELPLDTLLRSHGVDMYMRPASGRKDKGGVKRNPDKAPAVTIGATLAERGGKSIFTTVSNGGPAEQAGVAPGDQAVALGGLALTTANIDNRLCACRDKDKMSLVVFRGDELITLEIRFTAAPEDTAYLELIKEVDLDTEARRAAWLVG